MNLREQNLDIAARRGPLKTKDVLKEEVKAMPANSNMTSTRVLITPEMAAEYLKSSKGNRGLRRAKVEAYKAAMLSGEWIENGDSIRFYKDGSMQDGHHRLTACVESGVSFYAILVFGLTKEAAKTVDKGATRSNADELALHSGFSPEDSGIAAGIAKHVMIHDIGSDSWAAPGGSSAKHLTAQRVTRWVEAHKDEVCDAVNWSKSAIRKGNTMMSKSHAAALLILGSRINEAGAKEFLEKVFLGYGVEPGSTEDHIRNALLAAAMGARKIERRQRLLSVAKSMKSRLGGRTIKHAQNVMFSPTKESVPMFPANQGGAA